MNVLLSDISHCLNKERQCNFASLQWLNESEWISEKSPEEYTKYALILKIFPWLEWMQTVSSQLNSNPIYLQWYNEALRIATEHFGEKNEQCGVIYFNAGLHHEKRGELQEVYENFKWCYLIEKEV